MTKTDWTAADYREASKRLAIGDILLPVSQVRSMLDFAADRIEADESAVPDVPDGMWRIGNLIERLSDIKERFGNTCVWMETCKWGASALHAKSDHDASHPQVDDFEASKANPPAQPAQVDGIKEWQRNCPDYPNCPNLCCPCEPKDGTAQEQPGWKVPDVVAGVMCDCWKVAHLFHSGEGMLAHVKRALDDAYASPTPPKEK